MSRVQELLAVNAEARRIALAEAAKTIREHRQELFHDGLSADLRGMSPVEAFLAGCEQERESIAVAVEALAGD